MRVKCYYAHCMSLYNTPQETRDLMLLVSLGWRIDNPNRLDVQQAMNARKNEDKSVVMEAVFKPLAQGCDVLAFRALPDGSISSGVMREIKWAQEVGIPVIELPASMERRALSLELTREYLHEVGQR